MLIILYLSGSAALITLAATDNEKARSLVLITFIACFIGLFFCLPNPLTKIQPFFAILKSLGLCFII